MLADHIHFPSEKMVSNRDGFGEALLESARVNPNVWVVTADLAESTRVHWFAEEFPDRFVEVGVAEQNLVTVASGLAHEGAIPFAVSYAVFSPGRNWEQIRTTICYNDQPVKIVGSHAGLSVGSDGATHQALEDVALMRVLPNMVVIDPVDYIQAKKVVSAVINHDGPAYIRLSRAVTPVFTTIATPFEIGGASVFREGTTVTLIASGPVMYEALLAAELLMNEDLSVEVINLSSIKPLDETTILLSVKKTGKMVTVEDHQISGGIGGAIAELLSEKMPTPLLRLGVKDRFGQSGNPMQLYREYGIDSENIAKAIKRFCEQV